MNEILLNLLIFCAGLTFLIISSDWLIQSSVKFANFMHLTPLFIGAVLIAFGTSAPEAGVGIMAAIRNHKGIALGNIIGSNIANIGLIIGLCALIRPLKIQKAIFKREVPIMLLATVLFYVLASDLVLSRIDGIIFIVFFIVFCILSYRGAKKSFDESEMSNFTFSKIIKRIESRFAIIMIILASLAGIVIGADIMVRAGSRLAEIFSVPTWIIGITVFAIGTSLPELVTSLTATFKKVSSISVGNIVGSNIFNILFVLGIVAIIRPIDIAPSLLVFELPVLLVFSIVFFTVMRTGYTIRRLEGLVMFLGYIAFIVFLLIK
jgi:cation:H+ antiporter